MTVSINTWLRNWRSIISWNYVKDRMDIKFITSVIKQSIFESKYPMSPWITVDMIKILENLLKKSDIGFEFGSGNSTIWLARNTRKITSVEHDKEWYEKVKKKLKENKLTERTELVWVKESEEAYAKPILKIKDNSLDYCFVDGIFRDECILKAIDKLKKGGILIVYNVDNYFPKNKISISVRYKRDNQTKTVSNIKMIKIYETLEKWRCVWTTSGMQDTALWIKP